MTTRVVHVNSQEWKDTPEDQRVYIGRANPRRSFKASVWKNYRKIGVNGTRQEVIDLYACDIRNKIERGELAVDDILALKGKVLGCWCKPEDCHGDVLAWICDCPEDAFVTWLEGFHAETPGKIERA